MVSSASPWEVLVDQMPKCDLATWSGIPCRSSCGPHCSCHAHLGHPPPTCHYANSFGILSPAEVGNRQLLKSQDNPANAGLIPLESIACHDQSQRGATRKHQRSNLCSLAPPNLCCWTSKAAELLGNKLSSCQECCRNRTYCACLQFTTSSK